MEIINSLDDDFRTRSCNGSTDEMAILRITDLKQGVKNQNRVNVFVNSKYAFSLDIAQVVDFHLKVGMEITAEQLAEFKKASEFGKLYQRALEWVLTRPRSEKETRDYLWRKLHKASSDTTSRQPVFTGGARLRSRQQPPKDSLEALAEFSDEIISRLKSHGYLSDEVFSRWYVENRFVKKGVSQKRLKMELAKKGVSAEIIGEVLNDSERNDEEEILKMIAKKRARYDDEKLTAYLCRQGFQYQQVQDLVRSYGKD